MSDIGRWETFTEVVSDIQWMSRLSAFAYLYASSPSEERGFFHSALRADSSLSTNAFYEIEIVDRSTIKVRSDAREFLVPLSAARTLGNFFQSIAATNVVIDITSLQHSVWAPLIKGGIAADKHVYATYSEPSEYNQRLDLASGKVFYDLSTSTEGLRPIPGFINFSSSDSRKFCFVPMLGFEQERFSYLIENVQPEAEKIYPIIGLPGFRLEYPFVTYLSNQDVLLETMAWRNVRFATANCPFSAFHALEKIHSLNPGDFLKVAPIGTKPHALGSVLYSIINPAHVELIYDHPIRQANRTSGTGRTLIYLISKFISLRSFPND